MTSSRRAVIIGVAVALASGTALVTGQPYRAIRCGLEGRDGWTIEFPRESVTEAGFRKSVRDQTQCVAVTTRLVDSGQVPDGRVVRPRGARQWVARGKGVEVLVESDAGEGVIACGEPIRPPVPGSATEVLTCR